MRSKIPRLWRNVTVIPVHIGYFAPVAGSISRRNGAAMRNAPLTTWMLGSRAHATRTRAVAVSGPIAMVANRADVPPFSGKSVARRVHVRPSSRLSSTCTFSPGPRLCAQVIRRSVPIPQFAPGCGDSSFIVGAPIEKVELLTSDADGEPRLVTRSRARRVGGPLTIHPYFPGPAGTTREAMLDHVSPPSRLTSIRNGVPAGWE